MPDVQAQIQLSFEILDATLESFALVDTAQHADLIGACAEFLFGSSQAEVEALLSGALGKPMIPVTTRGVPELRDCWARVLALVQAYNHIGTGLRLDLESDDPSATPRPHCATWVWVDGVAVLVLNWSVELTAGGRTDPVFAVADEAGVSRQVMAMGHAAIRVPIG